jgi:ribulose-5-phosphate 4-epimerase/fuculose-1-phosphate aldolase
LHNCRHDLTLRLHDEAQARDEICRVGRSLFERGYVHATAGNISVRLADGGYLITPTDACLGTLQPERLARLDAKASRWRRPRQQDHCAAPADLRGLQHRPPARCVIHTHSTHWWR